MDRGRVQEVLKALQRGEHSLEQALDALTADPGLRLPEATLDLQRALRTGHPEIVFGQGKSTDQIIAILQALAAAGQDGMVTRVDPLKVDPIRAALPAVCWFPLARILHLPHTTTAAAPLLDAPPRPRIAVVCAGTSDLPIAEEAAVTAELLGHPVDRHVDVGVAGLHRLLDRLPDLQRAAVIIVVAGMEGALPSVVAGLLPQPIIAVPTSIGYGASFGGLAALLGMLSACAAGISVVNIDNGFGAALFAARILRSLPPTT